MKEVSQHKAESDIVGEKVAKAGNKQAEKVIDGLEEPVKTECVIDFSNIPRNICFSKFRITIKERLATPQSN